MLSQGLEVGMSAQFCFFFFVIIFVCSEIGKKKLNCFGKQSCDLMPALRIGWHATTVNSHILSLVLATCLFCLFKSMPAVLGETD